MTSSAPRAAILIIGDEILSGRTVDANMAYAAPRLAESGAPLHEVRVVSDAPAHIVAAVNALRADHDYVFTSGGIGPTHDDRTTEAVAAAFGVSVIRSEEAFALLSAHYGADFNAARQKMAHTPAGATLIPNPVSVAPGYRIENVYVMAGVPAVFRAMFDWALPQLAGGPPMLSRSVEGFVREGDLSEALAAIQGAHGAVTLGSYPFFKDGRFGAAVVGRGVEEKALDAAMADVAALMARLERRM